MLDDEGQHGDSRNFEAVADALKNQEKTQQCLQVMGLVKQFGEKRAVDGTSLTMYNGQIFALLGHNGAGKTTTISMLTGLLEPTDGFATVEGLDIFNNMQDFRKHLGVCPQHDVLFEYLTPAEHLRLFSSFKGTQPTKIQEQVKTMLEDIELVTVKDQLAKNLSGGQKRKLSVAIAMIGDSKIVMLDEPTSGMDTSARRRLWEMLKRNKQGRIIILTTHYMDEADILGDRIAIMAEGKVVCTGSSLFLKNRFGVGYNLVIAKNSRDPAPEIDKFVTSKIDNVKKLQEVSSEITYQLPSSSSKQFKDFFQEFDQSLAQLGIRSYGVGITTLEEVFLKIGHGESIEDTGLAPKGNHLETIQGSPAVAAEDSPSNDVEDYSIANNKDSGSFLRQFRAILRKKILMQVRDRKTLAIDTIFPVLLILVGLALSTISFFKNGQVREMTPSLYTNELEMIYNSNSALIGGDGIKNFMENNFRAVNSSSISLMKSIAIEKKAKVFEEAGQLDRAIFESVYEEGHQPYFGQFYVQSLNERTRPPLFPSYRGILLVNATSQEIPAAFGGLAHVAFLRHFLNIGKDSAFDVKFAVRPFPISQALESLNKTIAGSNCAILMTIAWMMISDSLLQSVIKERQKNIKH